MSARQLCRFTFLEPENSLKMWTATKAAIRLEERETKPGTGVERLRPSASLRDRNVTESRDVWRKGAQTTQSHFQQGRSDFGAARLSARLPLCSSYGMMEELFTVHVYTQSEQTRLSKQWAAVIIKQTGNFISIP